MTDRYTAEFVRGLPEVEQVRADADGTVWCRRRGRDQWEEWPARLARLEQAATDRRSLHPDAECWG